MSRINTIPSALPDRDVKFLLDRLKWLDQEITRYRDFEWKATSFHAALFAAVVYALLDTQRRPYLAGPKWFLLAFVGLYATAACAQLLYIHRRLNARRNDRSQILTQLNQTPEASITSWWGWKEGWGLIFPATFVVSLLALAIAAAVLLWQM